MLGSLVAFGIRLPVPGTDVMVEPGTGIAWCLSAHAFPRLWDDSVESDLSRAPAYPWPMGAFLIPAVPLDLQRLS